MCCFAIYMVMPLPKQNISTSAIQFVVLRLMWLLPLPTQSNIHHHPMCCFEVHEVIVTPQAKQHTPPSNVLFWGSCCLSPPQTKQHTGTPNKATYTTIQCVVLRFMWFCHSPNKTTYQYTKQNSKLHHPMCYFEVHGVLTPPHPTPQTKHHISHYYQQLTCCFAVYEIPPLLKQNTTTPAIQCVVFEVNAVLPLACIHSPYPLKKLFSKKERKKLV